MPPDIASYPEPHLMVEADLNDDGLIECVVEGKADYLITVIRPIRNEGVRRHPDILARPIRSRLETRSPKESGIDIARL